MASTPGDGAPAYLPPRDRWHVWPTATAARRAFLAAIERVAPEVLADLRARTLDAAAAALDDGPVGSVRWWRNPETGDLRPEVILTPEQEARLRRSSPVLSAVEAWAARWRLWDGYGDWRFFVLCVAAGSALAWAKGGAVTWVLPPDLSAVIRAQRATWVPVDATAGADAAQRAAAAAVQRDQERLEAAGWVRDARPHSTARYAWLAAWQCQAATYGAMTTRFGVPLATLRSGIPAAAASVGLIVRRGPA
jgi:hypothetical protein